MRKDYNLIKTDKTARKGVIEVNLSCHIWTGRKKKTGKNISKSRKQHRLKEVTRKTITRTDLQTGDVLGVGVLCDVPRPRHHGQAARHRPHHLQQVQPAAGGDIVVTAGGDIDPGSEEEQQL